KINGATKVLKIPPSTPPIETIKKNSVSRAADGRERARSQWQGKAKARDEARCNAKWGHTVIRKGDRRRKNTIRTNNGVTSRSRDNSEAGRCLPPGSGGKATINVNRYNANGMIQKSGTEAMSVTMYVVTPSIKLDGTKASASQRNRCGQVIGCAASTADAPSGP